MKTKTTNDTRYNTGPDFDFQLGFNHEPSIHWRAALEYHEQDALIEKLVAETKNFLKDSK